MKKSKLNQGPQPKIQNFNFWQYPFPILQTGSTAKNDNFNSGYLLGDKETLFI